MKKSKTGSFTPLGFEFNKKNITVLSVIAFLLIVAITLGISLPLALKTTSSTYETTKYYTLSFDTLGVGEIESRTYGENDIVEELPTLYKDKSTFLGWKNKETDETFVAGEKLTSDIELVAKFIDNSELSETEHKTYITFVDVDKDFSILLDDTNNGLNAEQVKNGVKLTSITHPDRVDFTVFPEGDKFRLSSATNFAEGGQYILTIQSENLVFDSEPNSVYIMYFNVKKAPVLNLSARDGIIYLPLSEISEFTGTLGGLFTLNGDGVIENEGGGTFCFEGNGIEIGDTVAIFDKLNPYDITLDDDYVNNHVAYLKIADIQGKKYVYVNPKPEDVLFKPDILPVDKNIVTLGENYLIANLSYFDYSNGEYAQMGLDSDTVVEKGDYIAVFDGANVLYYAKITEVVINHSQYDLTFEKCSFDDVQSSMEVYNTKNVDTEKVLDDEFLRDNEKSIYDDLYQSGKLVNLATEVCNENLANDRFIRFCRDNNVDMTGLRFYAEDNQVKAKSVKKVEVDPKFKIVLSPILKHFTGENGEPLSGLRCEVQINVEITFECSDNAEVSLEVQAVLIQEIRIAMNIGGYAEWDWWFIFPYIKEYHFNAYFEFYTYSAVDFNITVATKEPDEEWEDDKTKKYFDFAKKLKDYLEKEKYYTEEIEGGVSGLADRYSQMLEIESDYVPIFEKTLFEVSGGIDPFHILCYKFEIKFVVGINAQVSLGLSFEYENAKRFVYSVELFAKKVKSDTIDLVEEAYSLEAYAMGKLGIKVGFEASIELGLFSTDLDSIGLTAGVGAYADLYGYVYYRLDYSASKGRTSDYYGALYFEVGIYFELSFKAQAFKGTFEYEKELLEYKWPLYNAGNVQNVLNFTLNNEGEEYSVELYGEETSIKLDTDTIFSLYYLNLTEGETDNEVYAVDNFDISLTNKKYHFDQYTGLLMLTDTTEFVEDCKIIITYTGAWLSFSKDPVQLVIDVHWDRLDKEGYSITFDSVGGGYVSTIFAEFAEEISLPKNPTKAGYNFIGWFVDSECLTPFEFPDKMGSENITVYAGWELRNDVVFTVEHMTETLESGKFTLYESKEFTGTAFEKYDAEVLTLEGFSTPTKQIIQVSPDGKSVVRYYYTRNSYAIKVNPQNGENTNAYVFKYGANVILPKIINLGYDFLGFDKDVPAVMPAHDMEISALWTESDDTLYLVEHYLENLLGEYDLVNGDVYHGKTGSLSNVSAREYNGFTPLAFNQQNINADGSTLIKIHYTRNIHTLTWILNTDCGENYTKGEVKFGDYIIAPEPLRMGYSFRGFDIEIPSVMPDNDLTITAIWSAEEMVYKVEHYLENLNSDEYTLNISENLKGLTDGLTNAEPRTFDGFTATQFEQEHISANGDTVVKIYYTRNSYTLFWNLNGGKTSNQTEITLQYQAPIEKIIAVYDGYTFVGYAETLPTTMPCNDLTINLVWRANKNTPYMVNHLFKDIGVDSYTLGETETLYGETDTLTSAVQKNVVGFTANDFAQISISGDGSTVVEIYYARNIYSLDWNFGNIVPENDFTLGLVEYGESIIAPVVSKIGYEMVWDKTIPSIMPSENLSITAIWTALDVEYVVNHYTEKLISGENDLALSKTFVGKTDSLTKAEATVFDGFTSKEFEQINISGNGLTVVEIYYTRNSYTLAWDGNGVTLSGEFTSGSVKFGTEIIAPTPEKQGYTLAWDKEIPETMPSHELTFTASWTALNVDYTVKHYIENLDDSGYELEISETLSDKTDTLTKAESKNFDGFTANEFEQVNISGDGLTVVEIYYTRNSYMLAWAGNGVTLSGEFTSGSVKFGTEIIAPTPEKQGYTLAWDKEIPETMPSHELTFTASWTALSVDYTVKHYIENLDDSGYELEISETLSDKTDTLTKAESKNFDGFTANEFEQVNISGDGLTVVEIYYTRNSYMLVWDGNGVTLSGEFTSGSVKFGTTIIAPILEKQGYILAWDKEIPETMPSHELTFTASWLTAPVDYSVEHYIKEVGKNLYILESSVTLRGETGSITNATAKTLTGFTAKEFEQQIISGDGSTVVKIYYARNYYALTWNLDGAESENEYTNGLVEFETPIIAPEISKVGYELSWDKVIPTVMPAKDIEITAIWSAVNVDYSVEHYLKEVGKDSYVLESSVTLKGETASLTNATAKTLTGFTAKEFEQQIISGDGSTVVKVYYTRNYYTLNWNLDGADSENEYTSGLVEFETPIIAPEISKVGYELSWDKAIPEVMPARNIEISAIWSAVNVDYTVEHYLKEVGKDSYILESSVTLKGETTSITNATAKILPGFTANEFEQQIISGDGTTVVKIYYVRNYYALTWNLDGVESENDYTKGLVEFETPIIVPEISKVGYELSWDKPIPTVMPAYDLEISVVWAVLNVNYTVNHYTKRLGENEYDLYASETLSGKTDNQTLARGKNIDGFTAKEFEQQTINGNGSTVIEIFYERNIYNIRFVVDDSITEISLEYGAEITAPQPEKNGYTLSWDKAVPEFVGISDLTFTAIWTANTDTPYSVKHYKTELSGELTLLGIQTLYGTTDTDTKAVAISTKGFTANEIEQQKIKGDSSTVVVVIYTRNQYTVSIDLKGGNGENVFTFLYEENIEIDMQSFSKAGYTFQGFEEDVPITMPYQNLNLTCLWSANDDTDYLVKHLLQNVEDEGYTLYTAENKKGTTDSLTNEKPLEITGFSTLEITQKTIDGKGTTVVYIYYVRNTYTLTFITGIGDNVVTNVKYLSALTIPSLIKSGYTLSWDNDIPETMPSHDLTFTAIWTARNDIPYTVAHYVEELNGSYTIKKTDNLLGTMDGLTNASSENLEGFTARDFEQVLIVTASGNTQVEIYYKRNTYTLTWETSAGTLLGEYSEGEVKFGTPLIAPTDGTKTGYLFEGTNLENETMPAHDLIGDILWTPIQYTIRFDRNGGSGTVGEITATYDMPVILPCEGFSKKGYSFVGYSLSSDEDYTYAVGASVKNLLSENNNTITLYAKYAPISYAVNFNPNHLQGASGSGSSSCIAIYDNPIETPSVSSNAP